VGILIPARSSMMNRKMRKAATVPSSKSHMRLTLLRLYDRRSLAGDGAITQ
jgi:hypothetical protein